MSKQATDFISMLAAAVLTVLIGQWLGMSESAVMFGAQIGLMAMIYSRIGEKK